MKRLLFSLGFIWQRKQYYYKLLRTPKPKISFEYTVGQYIIKIAQTKKEWLSVLKLRFDVFFQEFSGTHPYPFTPPFDVDEHDFKCDHLIIIRKADHKVLATYRLRTSPDMDESFYTRGEFDLTGFMKNDGNKMELGRACVDSEHRQGLVIRLLWRGLCEYAARSNARYMFGCSSLTRQEMSDWSIIKSEAQSAGSLLPDEWAKPLPEFSLETYPEIQQITHQPKVKETKPTSLLQMYLAAGSKIGPTPAYDGEMDCMDIFTVLDFNDLKSTFNRRLETSMA
ncbi:MAG: GNAT family N-acetyltransferase [Bacteriovoracaceae bacterium]|nr:GNAT family N-acetyltransferase [Bacteriovoracaceae bacterium]